MLRVRECILALLATVVLAGVAHADIPRPPSFAFDALDLGMPIGPAVWLALLAAAIAAFLVLHRKGVPRWLAAAVCLLLFVGMDLGIYWVTNALAHADRRRQWNDAVEPTPAPVNPSEDT